MSRRQRAGGDRRRRGRAGGDSGAAGGGSLRARARVTMRRLRRGGWRDLPAREKLAILIGALTVVSLTIGIILGVRQLLPDPKPPRLSVLILVDTSRSMRQPFGRYKTKLGAVRAQIVKYARERPDSAIGLRFTGGDCSGGYVEPAVAFDRKNTNEIEAALQDARPQGKSNFASGLSGAVNDFDHYEAGGSARVQSIWAFLGSGDDQCTEDVYRAIEIALEGFDSDASVNPGIKFDFFGLGASRAETGQLKRLVTKLNRDNYEAYVRTPNTPAQLKKDVENASQRETPSS